MSPRNVAISTQNSSKLPQMGTRINKVQKAKIDTKFTDLWRWWLGFTYLPSAFYNWSGWMIQLQHHCITVNRAKSSKFFDQRISFMKSHSVSCISTGEHSAGSLRKYVYPFCPQTWFFSGKDPRGLKTPTPVQITHEFDKQLYKMREQLVNCPRQNRKFNARSLDVDGTNPAPVDR